jgi:cytochrome P450
MVRDAPNFLLGLAKTFGPIVSFNIFNLPIVLVTRPDLIHEVLVSQVDQFPKAQREVEILQPVLGLGLLSNNGRSHRMRRRLIQPAFHIKRIHGYAEIMRNYAVERVESWPTEGVIDLSEEMMQLTLFIVTKSLFDADPATMMDLTQEVDVAVRQLQESTIFDLNFGAIIPRWAPTPAKHKAQTARRTLEQVVDRFINQHRSEGSGRIAERPSLLAMLLLAQDEDGNRLDDEAICDEVITLFLAGHETTSNALTWAIYLLTQHPEIQTQLQQEIDTVLARQPLGLDALPQLSLTLKVIKEAMRLYPPAWAINGRQALSDTRVGEYVIPKDSITMISPYVQHRLCAHFPDPERFDPSRFTPEFEQSLPKHVYMPFGAGPRICIGNSFAMLEAQLILAALIQSFHFAPVPGQRVDPHAQITLAPKDNLHVQIRKRNIP